MQIQILSFDNSPVAFNEEGYLNATDIANAFGKVPKDYLKSERTQDYINALVEFMNSNGTKIPFKENQIVIKRQGSPSNGGGTWLHPKLAVDFARWLNPRFAVWCDCQIEKILKGEALPGPKPTKPVAGGLLPEQIEAVKSLHNTLVAAAPLEKQAALAVMLWSAVKSKFGCGYKSVAPEHFVEVLSVMSRAAVADSSGEALPRLPRQYFELLAKMALYADNYQKMQHLLCTAQGTPEGETLWTSLTAATAPDQSGYLFVFRPNLKEDVQQAFDWLHQQSQALPC